MIVILTLCLAFFNLAILRQGPIEKRNQNLIKLLLVDGFFLRFAVSFLYYGHGSDMGCFAGWSDMMVDLKPWGFYESGNFADYPPIYMYVLWILGAIKRFLSLEGNALGVLLKLPAMISDTLIGLVIYKFLKRQETEKTAFFGALLWVLNPIVILNSAIWGQVDSVFSLFVLLSLYYAWDKKFTKSFIWFSVAVFTKPQALFYTPVLLYMLFSDSVYPEFKKERFIKSILGGIGAVALGLLLCIPFGLSNVFNQYISTLGSYPYFSVNAFNLWSALGLNWGNLTPLGSTLGTVFIILTVAGALLYMYKSKSKGKFFLAAGFICFAVFTLSTKMHERYSYPAVLFLLIGACLDKKNVQLLLSFIFVTVTSFINTAYVLFFDADPNFSAVAVLMGFITVTALLHLLYTMFAPIYLRQRRDKTELPKDSKIVKKDVLIMAVITVIYSVFAFYNLGNFRSPQSYIKIEGEPQGSFLADNNGISGMKLFLGDPHLTEENNLTIDIFDLQGENIYSTNLTEGSVFNWEEYDVSLPEAKSITFSTNGKVKIMEFALLDRDGKLIEGSGEAFDEQDLVPERRSYLNSTHFDEIYHARTAYEFLESDNVYEWTHPPLGKVFISMGVALFGMTPFGWRIVGTLFGIFMIPVMYIFAKKLFERRYLATFTAIIFAADFMHFTQTRIATIDVYITFFIMLMYMFMLDYLKQDFFSENKKRLYTPLFLSGLTFGLGVASKWTGIYAGAGLAILYFMKMYEAYKSSEKAVFIKRARETVLWSVLFFVAIPLIIYVLSYIPFMKTNGVGLEGVIKNQADMLGYHKGVDATHPFSSEWFKWPIIFRPIWYYSYEVSETVKEGISAFGNPLVWWVGISAFLYTAYSALSKKDKTAIFLTVGYLAELIPWVFVTRITFIYHYFTAVPFVALMIAYSGKNLIPDTKKGKTVFWIFAGLTVVLFLMFYPVLSGYPVSVDYVKNFLKWSSEWVLVAGA